MIKDKINPEIEWVYCKDCKNRGTGPLRECQDIPFRTTKICCGWFEPK